MYVQKGTAKNMAQCDKLRGKLTKRGANVSYKMFALLTF